MTYIIAFSQQGKLYFIYVSLLVNVPLKILCKFNTVGKGQCEGNQLTVNL